MFPKPLYRNTLVSGRKGHGQTNLVHAYIHMSPIGEHHIFSQLGQILKKRCQQEPDDREHFIARCDSLEHVPKPYRQKFNMIFNKIIPSQSIDNMIFTKISFGLFYGGT